MSGERGKRAKHTFFARLLKNSKRATVGAVYQGVNEFRSSQSPPFQGGVGVVRKVAQPPYRCCEASAFQSGALRGHLRGGFASFITTPCPSLERRGVSPQFQYIHRPRLQFVLLFAFLLTALPARAQDTRKVTEPIIPPVCSTLKAPLVTEI